MLDKLATLTPEQINALGDLLLKITAPVGATVVFMIGLWQYRQGQAWKRAEWVAQEMRSFFSDAHVRRALLMIDWGRRTITFPAEGSATETISFDATDAMIAKALQHHSQHTERFTTEEKLIRDAFDHFLDGLERFASFRAAGLVSAKDLRPYLAYWLANIRRGKGDSKTRMRLIQLRIYIEKYEFNGVQRLFLDYRHDPLHRNIREDWWRQSPLEDAVAAIVRKALRPFAGLHRGPEGD